MLRKVARYKRCRVYRREGLPSMNINDIYFKARDEWREAYPEDRRSESVLLKDLKFTAFIDRQMKEIERELRAKGIEVLD